jgi:hypothetical protein
MVEQFCQQSHLVSFKLSKSCFHGRYESQPHYAPTHETGTILPRLQNCDGMLLVFQPHHILSAFAAYLFAKQEL